MQKNSTALLVVAAALIDGEGRILMHRRKADAVHGGLWEFPGGKVEAGESPDCALVREIAEELGLVVAASQLQPLAFAHGQTAGPGSGRPLVILLYTCRRWTGDPQCLVGEAIDWFAARDLSALSMPPLDYPLAARLVEAMAGDFF